MENKKYTHFSDMMILYCDLAIHCAEHNSKNDKKNNCQDYNFKCDYYKKQKNEYNNLKKII